MEQALAAIGIASCQEEKGAANQKLRMRRPTNQMAALDWLIRYETCLVIAFSVKTPHHPLG